MPDSVLVGPALADFQEARDRVSAVIQVTPLQSSRYLAEILDDTVGDGADDERLHPLQRGGGINRAPA